MDVVIGAAFGDEGKGLITHHLASQHGSDAIVVRFNGGAQAGHTVQTRDQKRHVFHHVGSGAFSGAATYLSRFFVANPILFLEEMKTLQQLNINPTVMIDPDAYITTPYDMMINQMVEEIRDHQRHGSCGVGFSETIERNQHRSYCLKVGDCENLNKLTSILALIQTEWVPKRLKALNIRSIPEPWHTYIRSENLFEQFRHDLEKFYASITVSKLDLSQLDRPVVFEGAQGLMLDQEKGWFPHVTRSHTGLKNVLSLVKGTKQPLNVHYITRSYLTRHGAGPLPNELSSLPYSQVIDETNVTNPYQGDLRFAWFNMNLLQRFIRDDINQAPEDIVVHPKLAVTCLDQIDDRISYHNDDRLITESHDAFLDKLTQKIQVSEILCSYGPTIDTIVSS